jgi:hypothetical protein
MGNAASAAPAAPAAAPASASLLGPSAPASRLDIQAALEKAKAAASMQKQIQVRWRAAPAASERQHARSASLADRVMRRSA